MQASSEQAWDLVVVGAGPAGAVTCLAALRADPSLRVLLLDRYDFPRDKVCGDGVAPHVLDVLAEVGVHDVADGWAPLDRLDLRRGRVETAGRMRRPAWVIPRSVLDARLVRHATDAGAVLRRHRVTSVREDGEVVLVDEVPARVVVGADGAHSAVRTALGAPRSTRRAVAIRGYAPTPPSRQGRQVIAFGVRRSPAYAWAFDRGDGLSNVGYGELVTAPGDHPTRASMLSELDRLIPGSAEEATDWRAHPLPLSGRRWAASHERVLLVGDASHLINPLTGEGIYYAVRTGLAAGRAAAAALRAADPRSAGRRHDAEVRAVLARHLRHTWAAATLTRSPAVLDAGLRAAARDQRVFDDLVELGLGRGRITPRMGARLAVQLAAPASLTSATPDPAPTTRTDATT